MHTWKDNIHFVLVSPKEPGNIGASARALKNFGFSRLELVRPRRFPSEEAEWLAHGALDVLEKTKIYGNLAETLSHKSLVVGTTRRVGKGRGPIYTLKKAAAMLRRKAEQNPVAVLFGREDRGLLNSETAECAFLVNIPADPRMPSLNLAQAVLLTAYELSAPEAGKKLLPPELPSPKTVTHSELAFLFERLSEALRLLGYTPRGNKEMEKKILKNIRHLIMRAGLTDWEMKMLHGIITKTEERLKNQD